MATSIGFSRHICISNRSEKISSMCRHMKISTTYKHRENWATILLKYHDIDILLILWIHVKFKVKLNYTVHINFTLATIICQNLSKFSIKDDLCLRIFTRRPWIQSPLYYVLRAMGRILTQNFYNSTFLIKPTSPLCLM